MIGNLINWNLEKGQFRPSLTTDEIITYSKELHLNYGTDLTFLTYSKNTNHMNARRTMSLYFDVFYQLNLQVFYKNNPAITTESPYVFDISSLNFFHNSSDQCCNYLIEALDTIKQKNFLDGVPKLVMWLDKYVKKDSSGFCTLRDSCIHPDLYESSRKELEKKYPNELEFEDDNSLMRNSGKNINFLTSTVPKILKEISPHFQNIYFENGLLPKFGLILN